MRACILSSAGRARPVWVSSPRGGLTVALGHGEAMDTADEIEEREDNDGNSACYNTRTQLWGWTREDVEENIEERVGDDGVPVEGSSASDRESQCWVLVSTSTRVA